MQTRSIPQNAAFDYTFCQQCVEAKQLYRVKCSIENGLFSFFDYVIFMDQKPIGLYAKNVYGL